MYCVRARVRVCISDLLQNIMWLSGVETLMPIALLLFPHKKQQHCVPCHVVTGLRLGCFRIVSVLLCLFRAFPPLRLVVWWCYSVVF